jgi:hypothetical protein
MSLLSTPRAFEPEYVVFGVAMVVVGILAYVCSGQTFNSREYQGNDVVSRK